VRLYRWAMLPSTAPMQADESGVELLRSQYRMAMTTSLS
jgi:hypothetical protein